MNAVPPLGGMMLVGVEVVSYPIAPRAFVKEPLHDR